MVILICWPPTLLKDQFGIVHIHTCTCITPKIKYINIISYSIELLQMWYDHEKYMDNVYVCKLFPNTMRFGAKWSKMARIFLITYAVHGSQEN